MKIPLQPYLVEGKRPIIVIRYATIKEMGEWYTQVISKVV